MSSTPSSSSTASALISQPNEIFVCDEELLKLFPLRSISDVVHLFKIHLECVKEPDLTLLSIVTGIIENTLTGKCNANLNVTQTDNLVLNNNNAEPSNNNADDLTDSKVKADESNITTDISTKSGYSNFPVITIDIVRDLYDKFLKILSLIGPCKRVTGKETNKKSSRSTPVVYATREIIKHVSDVIWNSLIRSTYKDRAHLQSLYSYLADSKLDCFGVAFAVVAGCQQLGYDDVHLAISEDHAW